MRPNGTLLSIGGKNADINGWNPQNISHDWGATWESPMASPLPPLGTAFCKKTISKAAQDSLVTCNKRNWSRCLSTGTSFYLFDQ